jgi:hypothetical protein
MKTTFKLAALCFSAAAAGLPGGASAAEPTTGAYVSDTQNTWVQDRVGDRISTVNMIMCVMSSLRADAMVNQGPYLALVDEGKCSGRGDSSKAASTNAGESNATNFMTATVVSTQASATDPLIMKAWITEEQEPGQKSEIFIYGVATEGKSDANPNGLFSLNYCGKPAGSPDTTACMFKGVLTSDANGLGYYELEAAQGGGGGSSEKALLLQNSPSTDSGQGRVVGTDNGSPYDYTFAYNGSNFRRSDGTVDACFSRDKNVADYSTWRYGTYNADGSRLDASNPGFPVKYSVGDATYFGFWSFWGLWLPESALATLGSSGTLTRHVGTEDVPLSVVKRGGKLWKQVRQAATLGDFKSVSMMYWAPNSIGSLQPGTNYELQWNGTTLQAIGTQQCSEGGCTPQALSPAIDLQAADFRSAGANMVPIFFPSGGGNGAIAVPASGEFDAASVLAYRTRSIVAPDAVDAPATLVCLGNCPKSGNTLTAAFTSQPPQPFSPQSWMPIAAGSAASYTFSAGMLSDGGGNVDASTISKSSMSMFQGGLTSGSLVAGTDLANLRCDANGTPNTSGDHLCPSLVDKADVSYQWETGPNQWNQYFGAVGVTIDPPTPLAFAASNSNIRAADKSKYAGTTVQLQFNGFGELQGIPGQCVDPDTNAAVQCGEGKRWVPAFDIIDGSSVTGGGSTYYVKFLERELRLSQLSGTADASCKLALSLPSSSLTLPGAASITVDPVTTNGASPTLPSAKPAVIDGIVQ